MSVSSSRCWSHFVRICTPRSSDFLLSVCQVLGKLKLLCLPLVFSRHVCVCVLKLCSVPLLQPSTRNALKQSVYKVKTSFIKIGVRVLFNSNLCTSLVRKSLPASLLSKMVVTKPVASDPRQPAKAKLFEVKNKSDEVPADWLALLSLIFGVAGLMLRVSPSCLHFAASRSFPVALLFILTVVTHICSTRFVPGWRCFCCLSSIGNMKRG